MSVTKRNGGYTVRWRDSAGRAHSRQVALRRDAVALDGELKRKKSMGEMPIHDKGRIRLDDFWELWWENYAISNLTPRTRENYEILWRTHCAKQLGGSRLREIDTEMLASWSSRLSRSLSASSTRKVMAVLQGVLQRAADWGYIPNNPLRGIKRPKLVAKRRGRALTDAEVQLLIDELPTRRDKVVARVLVDLGLRPGELRAMQWHDVLFAYNKVRINKAVSRDEVGPTKTNSVRDVKLTPTAAMVLEVWRKESSSDFVFPGHDGGVWTDDGWAMWRKQVFYPAAERAELDGLHPYDLRHTFVSRLVHEGVDIYRVARQAGHAPTQALATYSHLFEEAV